MRQQQRFTKEYEDEAVRLAMTRCHSPYIGLAADTGQIMAFALTMNDVDDGSLLGSLLDQIAGPVASLTGDDACDTIGVFAAVVARHPDAATIVRPRSTAVSSDTAQTLPTQRDGHLKCLTERGRMGWRIASGHNKRSRVDTTIGRFKPVIGDGLRPRPMPARTPKSPSLSTFSTACWTSHA